MSIEIDSEALVLLNKGLGIGGSGQKAGVGGAATTLEDDSVIQVIDITGSARQGLSPATGLFYYIMQITTSVANPNLTVTIADLYEAVDAAAGDLNLPPFPVKVSSNFDIWLLQASVFMATTTFVDAALQMLTPQSATGYAIHNNDGTNEVLPAGGHAFGIAMWDGQIVVGGSEFGTLGGEHAIQMLNQRTVRGAGLKFRADNGGIGVTTLAILAALMPKAMGQDVAI